MQIPEGVPVFICCEEGKEFCDITEFLIYADGEEVCITGDLMKALCLYLSMYYIFNLSYPASLAKTTMFYDRVLLDIQDNAPKRDKKLKNAEKRVNTLISKINTMIKPTKKTTKK